MVEFNQAAANFRHFNFRVRALWGQPDPMVQTFPLVEQGW